MFSNAFIASTESSLISIGTMEQSTTNFKPSRRASISMNRANGYGEICGVGDTYIKIELFSYLKMEEDVGYSFILSFTDNANGFWDNAKVVHEGVGRKSRTTKGKF